MKKKIFSIIFVVSLLFSIIPMNSYAAQTLIEWDEQTINNPMKEWTIKFNYAVNKNTIKSDNIFVEDSEGNKVETYVNLDPNDKKSIVVEPINPYEEGKTYYLFIANNIKSGNNKKLKKGIKMPFVLKEEVIIFKDINLEKAIRDEIDKPEGDIYKSEVEDIRKLDARDEHISDLEGIQYLTNLEDLDLAWSEISNISLLKELINLEEVDLRYNEISDISSLSNLIDLDRLDLDGNKISDISPLSNLINLENLELNRNEIMDISPLRNLINLNGLGLEGNKISDISPLSNLINLENLDLCNNEISDINLLSNLINLNRLYIDTNKISDISPLNNLIKLEKLDLSHNEVCDITSLSDLIDLETLFLDSNKISDIGSLRNLVNLETLYISYNEITDYSPVEGYYNNLKDKDFKLNKEEAGEVIKFKDANLEKAIRDEIDKPEGDIYQSDVEDITKFDVDGHGICDLEGIEYLTNLENLDLGYNEISDITTLSNLIDLDTLYIDNNKISDINPLRNLVNLEALRLSYNDITDYGPVDEYYDDLKYKDFEISIDDNKDR